MKFTRALRRTLARLTLRGTVWATLAAFTFAMTAGPAYAGGWRQQEIKWHKSSVGSPFNSTGIYQRDTVYTVLAASIPDTSGVFSASSADVWPGNGATSGNADTLVVGFLVIESDTTAAVSSAVTSCTYEIDGRGGAFGVNTDNLQGWTQVDSNVVLCVADAAFGGTVTLPVMVKNAIFGSPQGAGALTGSGYLRLMSYDNLRCRITATTGVMAAARIFWRWWDEEAR